MTSTAVKSQTAVHIQYRNGTYYGQISTDYKRNGKGMLILDTSTVLFADWKDNMVDGMYVYLSDGIRAYGGMVNGKLDGYNIISTTKSYSGNGQSGQYSQGNNGKIRTFYGMFRNDKIYGRCVVIDNDCILTCQYGNNELQQIISKKALRQRQLYDILRQSFPNNIYSVDQYLTVFIKNYISQLQQLQQVSRYQPCINYFSNQSDQKFYGFQEVGKPNRKFGIVMIDNQLVSVGEHANNLLQGIGRLYAQQHVYDGAFRNGQIDGIGIDFHLPTNKFILQVHDGFQDRVQKGFGFPLRQILQFRKEFHLRSIFFYNDIAILNLKIKFEGLIAHIFISPKRPSVQQRDQKDFRDSDSNRKYSPNNKSGSKRIQHSPLRQRLLKYEQQSDVIEDNSPIKNRPNQYRPVDRTSSYFKQDNSNRYRNQDRGTRAGQGYQYKNNQNVQGRYIQRNSQQQQHTHSSNQSQQRNNQRFSQKQQSGKSRNKFQQRQNMQKQTYNEILRQNPSNSEHNDNHLQSKSNLGRGKVQNQNQNYQNSRQRKHTKDLVQQLQNVQKQRRLTLDQIYSKSNLYGRKKR